MIGLLQHPFRNTGHDHTDIRREFTYANEKVLFNNTETQTQITKGEKMKKGNEGIKIKEYKDERSKISQWLLN